LELRSLRSGKPGARQTNRARTARTWASAVSSSPLSRAKVSRSNLIFDGGLNWVQQTTSFAAKMKFEGLTSVSTTAHFILFSAKLINWKQH
jgi:hypothetical protein